MIELENEINAVYEPAGGVVGIAVRMLREQNYQLASTKIINVWKKSEEPKPIFTAKEFLEREITKYYNDEKCKKDAGLIARAITMERKPYFSVQFETVKKYLQNMGLHHQGDTNNHGGARNPGFKRATTELSRREKEKKRQFKKLYRGYMSPETIYGGCGKLRKFIQ